MTGPGVAEGADRSADATFVGEALTQLFDDAEDARLLLNPRGVIISVNAACEAMFGYDRSALVGQTGHALAPEDVGELSSRLDMLLGATEGPRVVRFNIRARHDDGHSLAVRVIARVIDVNHDARLLSLVLVPRTEDGADRHFRSLLEAAPDGKVLVDADGRIVMTNSRISELFGYADGELIHQRIEALVPEALRDTHVAVRGRFAGQARRHTMGLGTRVEGRRKDGSTFPVLVVLSSLVTDEGLLVSATVRDTTEQDDLRRETSQMKDQFLATVSHELRTPLTSVVAGLEMLIDELDELDDAAQRSLLQQLAGKVMRGARRQMSLVEDLLAITTLDAGGAGRRPALTDLRVVAESAVDAHLAEARTAGVTLTTSHATEPVLVNVDANWLGRAVDCLLSNAIKFTPHGGRVDLHVGTHDGQGFLEVRDTGPGIPAGLEEKVFERLYRAPQAVAAETPGAGLGLAIARSIVESAGGQLTVVPEPVGAHLRLTLPRPGGA
jgi:PAS domain S-box-containing protein